MRFHNYSLSFSARKQMRVYILTWSRIIICSSKPINREDLRATPLSLSVLLIFESLVLISWTSWFLLRGFLPLAPAPEERMRPLEHQSPLAELVSIKWSGSQTITVLHCSSQPPDPDRLSRSILSCHHHCQDGEFRGKATRSRFSTCYHYFNIVLPCLNFCPWTMACFWKVTLSLSSTPFNTWKS